MATELDEIREDFKSSETLIETKTQRVLVLAFICAVAAGSEGGVRNAGAILDAVFGKFDLQGFFRWSPVALGLYVLTIVPSHIKRIGLRRTSVGKLEDEEDKGLSYRVREDERRLIVLPKLRLRVDQLVAYLTPLVTVLIMRLPLAADYPGWNNPAGKELRTFFEKENVWEPWAAALLILAIGFSVGHLDHRSEMNKIR
ncbi:hypothetical protein [Luteolibacter sp. Populi]|uniref:hypothetical protein n=1 Tax=Luteolibacter sp. Populi TaxID=3230487 RepID=UPI003465BC3B